MSALRVSPQEKRLRRLVAWDQPAAASDELLAPIVKRTDFRYDTGWSELREGVICLGDPPPRPHEVASDLYRVSPTRLVAVRYRQTASDFDWGVRALGAAWFELTDRGLVAKPPSFSGAQSLGRYVSAFTNPRGLDPLASLPQTVDTLCEGLLPVSEEFGRGQARWPGIAGGELRLPGAPVRTSAPNRYAQELQSDAYDIGNGWLLVAVREVVSKYYKPQEWQTVRAWLQPFRRVDERYSPRSRWDPDFRGALGDILTGIRTERSLAR